MSQQKRKAPSELNKMVCDSLIKNGIKNKLFAKYFSEISQITSESKIFCKKILISKTDANIIASRLIYDFLNRNGFTLTQNTIFIESKSNLFTEENQISLNLLKIKFVGPPIRKLIHQRLVDSDSEDHKGWFNIESDVENTISDDELYKDTNSFNSNQFNKKISNISDYSDEFDLIKPSNDDGSLINENFSIKSLTSQPKEILLYSLKKT